jgi:hypothetical protein
MIVRYFDPLHISLYNVEYLFTLCMVVEKNSECNSFFNCMHIYEVYPQFHFQSLSAFKKGLLERQKTIYFLDCVRVKEPQQQNNG